MMEYKSPMRKRKNNCLECGVPCMGKRCRAHVIQNWPLEKRREQSVRSIMRWNKKDQEALKDAKRIGDIKRINGICF